MRVLILVNPQAGNRKGAEWLNALKDLAGRLGPGEQWRVEPTTKTGLQEQIRQMAAGMDSLIIVGGDGTVSQVLEASWAHRLSMPVGIVPLGTGNDMARSLGLYKGRSWRPEEILDYVRTSKTKVIDLWGLPGNVCFSNYASIGLDAAVVRRFCRLRQWMEQKPGLGRRGFYFSLYIAVWISQVGQRVSEGTVLAWEDEKGLKHEKRIGGARVLALTNTPYYAAGALMEPGARLDDGLLEVTLFRHMRHYAELMATRAAPLARVGLQERWWRVKARKLEILLPGETPVQADGEDLSHRLNTEGKLEVQRKAQVRVLLR